MCIRDRRKEGLAGKGEFSVENLAFKNLRNDQTIARLNELIIKSYDLMFSKEELKEKKHLADWEEAMLAALSTKNDKDSQPLKYGEKRPPLRHT